MVCLFSCKQGKTNTEYNEMRIESDSASKIENEVIIDNKNKTECITDIFLDREIPAFNCSDCFYDKSKSFLIDTLFRGFYVSYKETKINKPSNDRRQYLEFSQFYSPSPNVETLKSKENIFKFYLNKNGSIQLESVELNFPAEDYKNVKREIFKVKKDSAFIDIGINKERFAIIFEKDLKILCDTIFVGNETNESFYIFKEDKLTKIIFNFYTH